MTTTDMHILALVYGTKKEKSKETTTIEELKNQGFNPSNNWYDKQEKIRAYTSSSAVLLVKEEDNNVTILQNQKRTYSIDIFCN